MTNTTEPYGIDRLDALRAVAETNAVLAAAQIWRLRWANRAAERRSINAPW